MAFSQGGIDTQSVAIVDSTSSKSFCRKAGILSYGVVAIISFFLPGTIGAATSNLSCQVTEADSPAQSPINPVPVSRLATSDSRMERCSKPVQAVRRLVQSKHAHIVDVRRPENFLHSHLPQSINLPEHLIKTKGFLKPRPLLLVGGGHDDRQLFDTCLGLLHAGFKDVTVMDGGVARWHGLLNIDQAKSIHLFLPKIDSREAFVALRSGEWTIVTAFRQERDGKLSTLFPEHTILSLEGLHDQYDAGTSQSKYLVVGEDESSYQQTAERLHKMRPGAGYWLEGGVDEYSRFVNNRRLIMARSRRGPPKQAGCAL